MPVVFDLESPAPVADTGPALRAGMTVTVSVDTGHSRGLPKAFSAFSR